ncbi:MAG: PEP-CTERM sorting domain-containing protein [Phycisphaerales bacterium]|nr:PEP-CTERM sorting domain-containing protein [Phycisphaerales bacterium]
MTRIISLAALATSTLLTSAASASIVDLAHSSFDTDIENWTVRDTVNGNVTYYAPGWNAAGGLPDGHVEFADITPGGYVFEESTEFSGDFSAALVTGGVSFDWMADMIQDGKRASVILWSGNTRLFNSSAPDPAAGVWHSFSFMFNVGNGWQIDSGNGAQLASLSDIDSVLQSVTMMEITGETWTGMNETTWLDNPRIWARSVPAPGALALLGVAAITGARRRR